MNTKQRGAGIIDLIIFMSDQTTKSIPISKTTQIAPYRTNAHKLTPSHNQQQMDQF